MLLKSNDYSALILWFVFLLPAMSLAEADESSLSSLREDARASSKAENWAQAANL